VVVGWFAVATPPAAPPTTPTPTGGAEPVLPLDAYVLSPQEAERVARTHRALLTRCLRPFGLTLPQPDRGSPPDPAGVPPQGRNGRRYGITDVASARVWGYRLPPATGRPSASPAVTADPLLHVLSGDGYRIVRGLRVPDGGCHAEARRQLAAAAPPAADMFLAQRLSVQSHAGSRASPSVSAAFGAWSECMRTRGYDYADPLAVAGDPAFRGPVSTDEVTTALADIACKQTTRLVAVWTAAETRIQLDQISRHAAALAAIRRANDGQLAVARGLGL
jgi:hypothetical protein